MQILKKELISTEPLLTPRSYQVEALDAVTEAYKHNINRPLISLPTGTGKTVIFGHLIRSRSGRALVIAHRDELIEQAVDKIKLIDSSLEIGVIKGSRNEIEAQVVVASIQTLSKKNRLHQLTPNFETIVIDEAHHAVAEGYRRVLEYLGSFSQKKPPLTVGVTATPHRGDRVGLSHVFQSIVYHKSIFEMIAQGYLVDLRHRQEELPIDLNTVKTQKGDFVESELSQALSQANIHEHIVNAVKKFAPDRKIIVFVPGVSLALEVAKVFCDHGFRAEAIYGKMDPKDRKEVIHRLRTGETQVIVNCLVLTEGFDEPSVDCIVIARPTKSESLYIQMMGRGTRLHPGKSDCLIIDFTGINYNHKQVTFPTLFGLPLHALQKKTLVEAVEEIAKEQKQREQAKREQDERNRQEAIEKYNKEHKQQQQIRFHWLRLNQTKFALGFGKGFLIL